MNDISKEMVFDVEAFLAGNVHCPFWHGMNRDQLVAMAGEPEAVSVVSRKADGPGILKYGSIEFHFDDGSGLGLYLIHFDVLDPVVGSGGLHVVPGIFAPRLGVGEASKFLSSQGVLYEVVRDSLGFHVIHVGSHVDLIFEENDRDGSKIELFEVSIRPERRLPCASR